MSDVNKKMAKGAAWMVLFKIVERSIGLVSTVILARLLVPADFGLVALAMAIIAVLEVLGSFSFDVMLIQKQQADRSYYDTAWTFNVIVGISSAIMLVLLAQPVAEFYDDPRLEWIIYALMLAPLASGFENIGVVAFRKEMEFHKEFKFLVAKKIVAFTVTLLIALTFRNYWALIIGSITGRISGVLLSYLAHAYRPRFSLAKRHELFHFSKWLFINNLINFVNNKASDFIVGKMTGAHALGLFSIAYEVSNMPTTELVAPINRAVFSGYARVSEDLAMLRAGYLNVLGLVALFSVPVGLGIAATSDVFVPLVLGNKWLDAIPLIEILAFNGLAHALQSNTGSVYLVLNKPKILTMIVSCYCIIFIPTLIAGVSVAGSVGAASGMVVCSLIVMPFNLYFMRKYLQLHFIELISVVWRPLVAGALMFALIFMLKPYFQVTSLVVGLLIELVSLVLVGALTYSGIVMVLWAFFSGRDGAERMVLNYLSERFSSLTLFQRKRRSP